MTKLLKSIVVLQVLSFALFPFAASAVLTAPDEPVTIDRLAAWLGILTNWVFTVIMALAALVVLVGAFNILTAGGDAAKITTGKNWIVWGIVGVVVAILARGLLDLACTFITGQVCP